MVFDGFKRNERELISLNLFNIKSDFGDDPFNSVKCEYNVNTKFI